MSLWQATLRVVNDVTSLGGTARLRNLAAREKALCDINTRLCVEIASEVDNLKSAATELERKVGYAIRTLRHAGKMLDPLGQGRKRLNSANLRRTPSNAPALVHSGPSQDFIASEAALTATSMGIGSAVAVASWSAVQLLGQASTGTAMAVLHGAAAANAGWAWFGGGSLAVGGGGMAAGHLVLPGIGTAVAIGFASVYSHIKANKLEIRCNEIQHTLVKNRKTLERSKENTEKVRGWTRTLELEYEALNGVVMEVRKKLFRFGWFSHLWRLLRTLLSGRYYRETEQGLVEDLDAAVVRFMESMMPS